MPKPVFFDPQRKRWKRIRRIIDITVVTLTALIVFFIVTIMSGTSIPKLLLQDQKKPYHALKQKESKHPVRRGTHRKSKLAPSQVVLNQAEGIRGAFYVTWDAASFSSLKEYVHQIDLLFPEWLHVLTPDGRVQGVTETNTLFDVVSGGRVQRVDDKVMPFLKQENAETEVLPLINNFDPAKKEWQTSIGDVLKNDAARTRLLQDLAVFLGSDRFKGITLDFEEIPEDAQAGYLQLVKDLAAQLHARGMKLYISVPPNNSDFDFGALSQWADGLILMNYDQHFATGKPGAVAGQDWFEENIERALKSMPREKLICAIGNYGYEWATDKKTGKPIQLPDPSRSVQQAWLSAAESETDIDFDPNALNPHYAFLDENNDRHDVWFLDAVTALNQMRGARRLGITTFALWRLGSEDRSLWSIWDQPGNVNEPAPEGMGVLPPGQDVDMEGSGEILRIEAMPSPGKRQLSLDHDDGMVSEEVPTIPSPYQIGQFGATPKKIAITFDDGPDPTWTPKILDVLKQQHAKAAFFLIGLQAEKYGSLTKRIYEEGHEIGNHTFTHPDISNISKRYMRVELNLTERLFAGRLGVKPVLFRPPYSIDQEPDTADQVRPLEIAQNMGYITVGDKIDPNDWRDDPRPSAEEITEQVLKQVNNGNIVLLHDGGGDRRETVRALPMIIGQLRARGYEIVPVSELLGRSYKDVMPPISANEQWSARIDSIGFWLLGLLNSFIVMVFFIGDVLMTGRLLIVGALAIFDRFHRRKQGEGAVRYAPAVAVLIPAYNEEKVIERTVRAVLDSDYTNLRAIVIDDGSKDRTYEVARKAFASEIATGRVTVLRQQNAGKAAALNFALENVTEEIFVGIDADTIIAHDAISYLVPHFADQEIGALAGNAKVGNMVNLWTRWQALEYITSQNFERRALNTFSAVSVVPGAIGAWRTEAVRAAGCYHIDTVAEDADLTMALLQNGYKVEYEDRALAYTEAPTRANGLMRQRFRWSFGILQATWKHRSAFGRKGPLGFVALPNILIFQIMLPLVSPFIDLMFAYGALKYLVYDKYFHPETADPASFQQLVLFFAIFMVIDFIASAIAFSLERRHGSDERDFWLLGHVWLQRFAYRQLFSVVLFKTLKRAAEGGHFSWDKLERTATVRAAVPSVPAAKV